MALVKLALSQPQQGGLRSPDYVFRGKGELRIYIHFFEMDKYESHQIKLPIMIF